MKTYDDDDDVDGGAVVEDGRLLESSINRSRRPATQR